MVEDPILESVMQAARISPGCASESERKTAVAAFHDTLGVMAAGVRTSTVLSLARAQFGSPPSNVQLLRWLLRDKVVRERLPDWLLLAGTAAHALDFDDVLEPMNGHPSAVLIPTVWGVGRSLGAETRAIVDAYIAGVRVCGAISSHVDVRNTYAKGWHTTATIGVIASAVSSSRLLSLSTAETVNAIGIAASLAGGIRQNFGTDTKPLHTGVAARSGFEAALWAKSGLTSSGSALDGKFGWAALLGSRDTGLTATCGASLVPLEDPGLDQKPYPCCYNTQRLATAGIRANAEIAGRTIVGVHATVESGATQPLIYENPRSGLEAKFSAQYVLAESLLEGKLPLSSFTDSYVEAAPSRQLISRITVEEQAMFDGKQYEYPDGYANIIVELSEGAPVEVFESVPWGHHNNPLPAAALSSKMRSCLTFAELPDNEANALLEELSTFTKSIMN